MKRIDQFKKLLEVQESIGGGIDLVSPTREVLKEGRMVKISARTGDHQDRYLFLLSDLLLLCSPRKSMMAGNQFGLRARWEELHWSRMLTNADKGHTSSYIINESLPSLLLQVQRGLDAGAGGRQPGDPEHVLRAGL